MLTYAIEVLDLSKSDLNCINFTFGKALYKIFKTSDVSILDYCMHIYGIPKLIDMVNFRKDKFLKSIKPLRHAYLQLFY